MAELLQISAKTLARVAMPDFCPRCFWLSLRMGHKMPWSIFPGIFSSIDACTKRMVQGWFDGHGASPAWLNGLGPVVGYRDPPHWGRFKTLFTEHNILLTGAPDAVLVRPDGSHLIGDYKTAKFTETQDALFPMYEAQLNAYAVIAQRIGQFVPVSALALMYFQPISGDEAVRADNYRDDGFVMGLSAHVLMVDIRPDLVPALLAKVRALDDRADIPPETAGCKDCELVRRLDSLQA